MRVNIYSPDDIEGIRKAGKLASHILSYIEPYVVSGVTTNELDRLCHEEIVRNGAVSASLGYNGFPKSVCISLNEVVCHGIPSERALKDGDILNIDVTVILDGWHADTSRMYTVGKVSSKAQELINTAYEAMMSAIETVKNGSCLGDIGAAVEGVAEKRGMSVVRDYCGHGVGRKFHEDPMVLHYGKRGAGLRLKTGNCFTIEPMINLGSYRTKVLSDDWTAVTEDGSLSAQFEHTVVVTESGVDILTL